MGARASQLRNRQQVQDSSSTANGNADVVIDSSGDQLIVAQNQSNNNNNIINNNNNLDVVEDDVARIKNALHAIGNHIQQENREAAAAQQLGAPRVGKELEQRQQQANGNSSSTSSLTGDQQQEAPGKASSRKGSTLSRQASQIQSLAQRLRRSSSVRIPKLRALIPFGKRKVSLSSFLSLDLPQAHRCQCCVSTQSVTVYFWAFSTLSTSKWDEVRRDWGRESLRIHRPSKFNLFSCEFVIVVLLLLFQQTVVVCVHFDVTLVCSNDHWHPARRWRPDPESVCERERIASVKLSNGELAAL